MGFLRSIVLLAGVACCVSFAVFAGHALSVHSSRPLLMGLAALAVGVILLFGYSRAGRSGDKASQHQ